MRKNITEAVINAIRLVAVLIVILFGAASCTDEHFIDDEGATPPVEGDTIYKFDAFKLVEADWAYSNGLAKADHYYDGKIYISVNNQIVDRIEINHENATMRISWEPIAETTSANAEKMYLGQASSEAKFIDSKTNQKVNFSKYERECKLSFVGMEVVLTGSWYEASLSNSSDIVACRYDSTTVATQRMDTVKVDGTKVEVELDGQKYNRVNVIASAMNHFTDMPANTPHSEQMDIQYSVLVPVVFVPGEKFYEGSIAGSGSYVKASEESYRSSLELTHIFTQDGQQLKEQETVSGLATVKTWVETAGPKMVVSSIKIGNPTVSVSESTSDLYQKEGYIYAKKYTTVWSYTWSNGFSKKVYSEVERLYYMREEGKAVAMPYGETSTSFKNFNAGNSVEKSENNKKYDAYPNGVVSFNGSHKSTTGNVNDAIAGLEVGQEFWVAQEDKFLGYDKEIVPGDQDNDSKIIITEHWSVSGDKEIVYTQSANYTFAVSGQQRVFGEVLNFVSGPAKSTNSGKFNEVKENQYVSTVTDTYTAKFNLCDVKATASYNKAYIEYRNEKINFEFAAATVSYQGINNPTATEVEADGKLYSRLAYEVTFKHNLLGNKVASVLVDKEINLDPSTPDEWGEIDIEKTKAYGRICVTWKEVAGQTKLQHFYSGTIVTTKGIISFSNGYSKFTAMDTNIITKEVGNGWDGANLNPAYITVSTNPNVSWQYYDVVSNNIVADIHSSKMQEVGGIDFNKPFVANGGNANVYNISENGNVVRVVITYNGEVLFTEVFAK